MIPLIEYFPVILTEAASSYTPGKPLVFRHILLQRANSKNRNGRIYPKSVLEPVLERYNEEFVKTRRALGELDHRSSMIVELKNVSHLVTEMHWEGDEVYGDIEILDTPSGRILTELAVKKIPFGISSRAQGSVMESEDAIIVQNDLEMMCFDTVSFESTQGSTLVLNEGLNAINNKYNKIDSILSDIICSNTNFCPCKLDKK